MWYQPKRKGSRLRQVRMVADGRVYSYTDVPNGVGSFKWPYIDQIVDFLCHSYDLAWFWEFPVGQFNRASLSTRVKYRRIIASGSYIDHDLGKTLAQRQKEQDEWLQAIAERKQWDEAKRSVRALRRHLRARNSPTLALPQEPTSRE